MKGQTNNHILGNKLQRALRNNMTDAERQLWLHLRRGQMNGFKFRRQHPFGDYILDFVCLEARLIIEVDGGQHAAHEELLTRQRNIPPSPSGESEARGAKPIEGEGNISGVSSPLTPAPLPEGEGKKTIYLIAGLIDAHRAVVLEKAGFRVLRFWNHEVLQDLETVKETIWQALQTPPPSQPSPCGGRGEKYVILSWLHVVEIAVTYT